VHFDINIARGVITIAWFVLFIALWLSCWSRRRRAEYDAAARLPFEEDAGRGEGH
jgi:cytochrome c oxidase cbb3-type subunit IV